MMNGVERATANTSSFLFSIDQPAGELTSGGGRGGGRRRATFQLTLTIFWIPGTICQFLIVDALGERSNTLRRC
jgi:hypothetical protein